MKTATLQKSAGTVSLILSVFITAWAHAELFKFVDPVSGSVEYTNQPKPGAVRVNTDDTLSEIPTRKTQESAKSAPVRQASFRERSLRLKPGMDALAVEKLLGKPAKTNARTYGSATKEPWNGISWEFATTEGRLTLVFQSSGDSLYLNSWSWR